VRLATIHNLFFMHRLMERIRQAILDHTLEDLIEEIESYYPPLDRTKRLEELGE
jgi:tRNA-guanine family transglycosylase